MYDVDLSLWSLVSCINIMWGFECNERVSSWIPGKLELIHPVFQVIIFRVLICGFVEVVWWLACRWLWVRVIVGWNPLTLWVHLSISCSSFCGMCGDSLLRFVMVMGVPFDISVFMCVYVWVMLVGGVVW